MKTLSLPKLHYITSSDTLRPEMQYVKIENNKAMATDGHVAVVVDLSPLELELPNCYILARDWKKMCVNNALFRVVGNIVEIDTKAGVDLIRFIPEVEFNHKILDIQSIIPNKELDTPVSWIGLNAYVLAKFCAAFPQSAFEFRFSGNEKPIRFDAHNSDVEIYGAIMPIYIWKP